MEKWHNVVSDVTLNWQNFADVRASCSSADLVGNCVVFNVGGNKFRLITRIMYGAHLVYILAILTHSEYDKGKWKDECGCFLDPPEKED